jgi:phosphohistidine swiveling domain-containing protein
VPGVAADTERGHPLNDILDLREVPIDAEAVFGGKAYGLARLHAAGARVPAGFALAAGTPPPQAWPESLREAFIARAAALLAAGPVAVRSSAVGEDSASRSFAGLLESVLGVATVEETSAAVGQCIAAGASERARTYAGGAEPLAVGVVVQAMIDARAAGVCFTVDPTGRDGALLVEAVGGTGESLLGGRVVGERWRVYRTGLGALECRPEGEACVLTASEVDGVAGEAARLADVLGGPLDLEWAIDRTGALWWLQARPVTAAAAPPAWEIDRSCPGADDGPVTVWSNCNVGETMPDPLDPLTWSWWRDVVLPRVGEQLFGFPRGSPLLPYLAGLDLVHGRIYFNMNALLAIPLLGGLARRLLAAIDARTEAAIGELAAAGVLRPRRLPGARGVLRLRLAASAVRGTAQMARGLGPRRALRILAEDAGAIARRPPVAGLSDADLVEEMSLWLRPEARRLLDGLQMEAVAGFVFIAARHAFRAHPRAGELLAAGIAGNPTTAIAIAVDELAAAARPLADAFHSAPDTPALLARLAGEGGGRAWLGQLDAFLDRFGHRGPMEFDLGAPRWRDDPTMIVELVRAALAAPARETVAARLARLGIERHEAVGAAVAAAPWWRRPLLRRLARLVELYMPLREAPKHYGLVVFDRVRAAALELGHRLAARGVLSAADEVFLLEWPELLSLAAGGSAPSDLRASIAVRGVRLGRFRREQAPGLLRSDGVPVTEAVEAHEEGDGVLRGTAISGGRGEGPVRVLRAPDPRAMHDGDVLVVAFADPGWTPLFPRAAAVVMEVGGLLCHAAVVAREIGVPAVFGVCEATRRLADGERVVVDGSSGEVLRLEG